MLSQTFHIFFHLLHDCSSLWHVSWRNLLYPVTPWNGGWWDEYMADPTFRIQLIFLSQLIESDPCHIRGLLANHSSSCLPCSGHSGFLCFSTTPSSCLSLGLEYSSQGLYHSRFLLTTQVAAHMSLLWRALSLPPLPPYFLLSYLGPFSTPHFSLSENLSIIYSSTYVLSVFFH